MRDRTASLYTGQQPEVRSYRAPEARTLAAQPKIGEPAAFSDLKQLTQTLAELPLPVGYIGDELEGLNFVKRVKEKSAIPDVLTVALAGIAGQLEGFSVLKKMRFGNEPALPYLEQFNFANPFVEETDAVLDRIDQISTAASDYDEDEAPPDLLTKTTARQFLLNVPGNLLVGADVFPYFGEVDVTWQRGDKRVKLIVPPASIGASPSVYQGQMQQGRVSRPMLKQNATSRDLVSSLQWLQS